jgi:FkbM family methyltransferase
MKKYFIDVGGWNSTSARVFRKLYDPECKYKIYTFEPEPDFYKFYTDLANHELIQAAAWIEDGTIEFYRENKKSSKLGGTLLTNKTSGHLNYKQPYKVKSVDLSNWLLTNFQPEDKIILKMDIEGAEYQVIPKMVVDGSIHRLRTLMVEWHWRKLKGMTEEEHLVVENLVKDIPQILWPRLPDKAKQILGREYTKIRGNHNV